MIKAVFSIIAILLLASCTSPERIKSHYNNLGNGCVSIGKSMGDFDQCIGIEFRERISLSCLDYSGKSTLMCGCMDMCITVVITKSGIRALYATQGVTAPIG